MRPAIDATMQQALKNESNHPLKDFSVIHAQPVEWGDMDAFGHVNNVVYYDYAQRARIHYLEQLQLFDNRTYSVLAASSCQYYKSVVFPDTLWIGVRSKKVGNTSLTNEYVYYSTAQQAVVAAAESVLVFFADNGHTKQSFTDEQRAQILALDNGRGQVEANH